MATKIEWADAVWNPTTGCDRVSSGCDHCYALTMAKRLKGMGSEKYQNDGDPRTSGPGFAATEHADALDAPLRWRKPRKIFVDSMADLFHDAISDEFIAKVFAVMAASPQHTYQILTKRHARMRSLLNSEHFQSDAHSRLIDLVQSMTWEPEFRWPLPNVWLGVSAEDQATANLRVPALLETPAVIRFVSAEPLLGPVDLTRLQRRPNDAAMIDALSGDVWTATTGVIYAAAPGCIDWVIVGGESGRGPGIRPMHPQWARSLRNQASRARRAFLFKQWGEWVPKNVARGQTNGNTLSGFVRHDGAGWASFTDGTPGSPALMYRIGKKHAGRELDGGSWDQYPEAT